MAHRSLRGQPPAETPDAALAVIHTWTERKAKLFEPYHVEVAWEQLERLGWLPA